MGFGNQLFSARMVRIIDVGVVVWIVVWIALGVLVAQDIRTQAQLSDNVVKVGTAVRDTGDALAVVGGLPLVGGGIGDFAERIQRVGAEVEASGQDSHDGIMRLAWVAGIGVAVIPAALILLLYVPLRLAWRRDVRAVAAALPTAAGTPAFERYLAQRAATTLPWDRLQALSDDPWGDIAAGRVAALADAELARLGLARPPATLPG
jgi:hypothetical protein